jgi:enolase
MKAIGNVNRVISKKIAGMECTRQRDIDRLMLELDGTPNKGRLGANAILGVSLAAARLAASVLGRPLFEYIGELSGNKPALLPVPQLNIINGGRHAGQENDIQEYMIMPVGAKSFSEALRISAEVYHRLGEMIEERFGARGRLIGDEGGFVPHLRSVQERLEIIMKAVETAGYEDKVVLAIDSASSEFFRDGIYTIGSRRFRTGELVDFYAELCAVYPVASLEDGMAEDDWDGWVELTNRIGNSVQIVGDDLLVTNTERIRKAIRLKAANSALIKVNQIGTLTETLEAIKTARENGWSAVVSHRSGETEDSFIADLVVGVNSGQSKFGAPARSDRNAKYNRLLRIEEALGPRAGYPGRDFRKV